MTEDEIAALTASRDRYRELLLTATAKIVELLSQLADADNAIAILKRDELSAVALTAQLAEAQRYLNLVRSEGTSAERIVARTALHALTPKEPT